MTSEGSSQILGLCPCHGLNTCKIHCWTVTHYVVFWRGTGYTGEVCKNTAMGQAVGAEHKREKGWNCRLPNVTGACGYEILPDMRTD